MEERSNHRNLSVPETCWCPWEHSPSDVAQWCSNLTLSKFLSTAGAHFLSMRYLESATCPRGSLNLSLHGPYSFRIAVSSRFGGSSPCSSARQLRPSETWLSQISGWNIRSRHGLLQRGQRSLCSSGTMVGVELSKKLWHAMILQKCGTIHIYHNLTDGCMHAEDGEN